MDTTKGQREKLAEYRAEFRRCLNIPVLTDKHWLDDRLKVLECWIWELEADNPHSSSLGTEHFKEVGIGIEVYYHLDEIVDALSECQDIGTSWISGTL